MASRFLPTAAAAASTTMAEVGSIRPSGGLKLRQNVAIALHGMRILLAFIILCLDAYAIHFSGDLAMVFSLVLAVSTLLICTYAILCMCFFSRYYNFNIQLGLHWSFTFLWLVDLGLVGARAHQWRRSKCSNYTALEYSMKCSSYGGEEGLHVLQNGDTTSVKTYTGTLLAGVVMAVFQVLLWTTTTALFLRSARKLSEIQPHPRSPSTAQIQQPSPTTTTHAGPVSPPRSHQPRRMEAWESPAAEPPRTGPQPILPDSDEEDVDVSTGLSAQELDAGSGVKQVLVAQYVAQQAVEQGYDPYDGHAPFRQTPLRYWRGPDEDDEEVGMWDGRGGRKWKG